MDTDFIKPEDIKIGMTLLCIKSYKLPGRKRSLIAAYKTEKVQVNYPHTFQIGIRDFPISYHELSEHFECMNDSGKFVRIKG